MAKLKLHKTIVVVQRQLYSKQNVDLSHQQSLRQALIISAYWYKDNACYFNYVSYVAPTTTTKNDPAFVVGSTNMYFWHYMGTIYRGKMEIYYNFFASYHGCNPCDAAASQIKQKISTFQRDTDIPLYTVDEVIELIRTMRNHYAEVACPTHKVPKSPTFKKFDLAIGFQKKKRFHNVSEGYGYDL
ncbi:hypothetical protein PPL_05799 [Heterostelium album PN500]|uniref:Uncharacterized protein n=1 Tax=Heterostelium pallidum (strain ATCC 26659 / Pp 5 / PN500) TaxID=670386 RepID=D3BB67_HETP5|nr:hypothetical protein PPL_05799 [Heterostelium album PN500]EFA81804.1 hypothetical protein PPL_05799 [Heterostelium album PN500]|eukprot:XP_020433921.1 hypothetical protein PPL_05799 [Heterostelium album PN500]